MIDLWLFALLVFIPIILGILCSKAIPILTLVMAFFLLLIGAFTLADPTIAYSYQLNSSSNTWLVYSAPLPFTPYTQLIILVIAVIFIFISWAFVGEGD
jgi:hypothetical protein